MIGTRKEGEVMGNGNQCSAQAHLVRRFCIFNMEALSEIGGWSFPASDVTRPV